MVLKKSHPFLVLLLSLLFITTSKAQDFDALNASLLLLNISNNNCDCGNNLNTNRPFYDGKIILNNSTILEGKISVNQSFKSKMITIFNSADNYEPIDNKLIKEVVLLSTENKVTKFFNLNNDERLYRLVHQKDTLVSVYDSSNKLQDNSLIGRILIIENNTLTDTWNFWSSGPKKDLINYLNDRDDTTFKRRDFKCLDELFAKF
jgi:hypothetical protein